MELRTVMGRAAEAAVGVVRGIGPEQLGLPTPCQGLDVRALANHMIFWTVVQGYPAGLKQSAEEWADNSSACGFPVIFRSARTGRVSCVVRRSRDLGRLPG
jgi:hypothetical protein